MCDLAYVAMYARSAANRDSMSVYIVLYSIQYEQNVHVYSQLRLFLSYGQCPVPRCPDKRSLSVHVCTCMYMYVHVRLYIHLVNLLSFAVTGCLA